MGGPSRARSVGRSIARRLPQRILRRLRRVGRSAPIDRAWPEPPFVANPIGMLDEEAVAAPIRSYDVALFLALNEEYASQPLVPAPLSYDPAEIAKRSRARLAQVHERIGLSDRTVLEVGCGAGYEVWYLAHQFGSDAWGVDVHPRAAWPILRGDRVHLMEADMAGEHGLQPASFDRAVSFAAWEHIERPVDALVQLHRVLKPGGLAWIRANLYRGPKASHIYRHVFFPFPHLLFHDDVIAVGLASLGKPAVGSAWVNRLTWEQYEAAMLSIGFRVRSLRFDVHPLDEAFYRRFEDVLGRYPRADLERDFFTVVLEKRR